MFVAKVPARRFKSYTTTTQQQGEATKRAASMDRVSDSSPAYTSALHVERGTASKRNSVVAHHSADSRADEL